MLNSLFKYLKYQKKKLILKKIRNTIILNIISELKKNYNIHNSWFSYERKYNVLFSYEVLKKKLM